MTDPQPTTTFACAEAVADFMFDIGGTGIPRPKIVPPDREGMQLTWKLGGCSLDVTFEKNGDVKGLFIDADNRDATIFDSERAARRHLNTMSRRAMTRSTP